MLTVPKSRFVKEAESILTVVPFMLLLREEIPVCEYANILMVDSSGVPRLIDIALQSSLYRVASLFDMVRVLSVRSPVITDPVRSVVCGVIVIFLVLLKVIAEVLGVSVS